MRLIPVASGHRVFLTFIIWSLLNLIFLLHAQDLMAERGRGGHPGEVFAIGRAGIVGKNLAAAREKAISDALSKGVENYIIATVGRQGMLSNFERIIREILPGAGEIVQNFTILTEQVHGDSITLFLRLSINEEILDEKMREASVVILKGPALKVLFLVEEVRQGTRSFWWMEPQAQTVLTATDVALYKVFQQNGFNPIDRTLSVPDMAFSAEMKSPQLSDADIAKWGMLFSADVVVSGRSEIVDHETVSLQLKAVFVDGRPSRCLESHTRSMDDAVHPQGKTITGTLDVAVKEIGSRFIPCILRSALGGLEIHRFFVTLKGIKTYRQYNSLKEFLTNEVNGIKSIKQSRIGKNFVVIELEVTGDRNAFLQDVVAMPDHFPLPLKVAVTETGEITFTFLE